MITRREVLRFGVALGGALLRGAGPSRAAAAPEMVAGRRRYVIVNADDFGFHAGVNRGIVAAHTRGIVTSTSLMVTTPGASEAARLAAGCPDLSVGLHADFTSEFAARLSLANLTAVEDELERQLGLFRRLMGRSPTHLDSHHHAHLRFNVARVFLDVSERHGMPLRGFSPAVYIGAFYAQWPPGTTDNNRISAAALIGLLGQITPGLSQIACHPGYVEPGVADPYGPAREVELDTLTDPRVRDALQRYALRLVNYRDYSRLVASLGRPRSPAVSRVDQPQENPSSRP